ncbi:Cornifelin like B [Dissostichus eleginoides]|uniref:Cornifelin like B n=1 Tax=Dissostichus eleginoides TaxID=100907 RepID=A0AAD9BHJ2_DISEL|nr:Cornifelin like B [Dissostichus eleginoides]
MVVVTQPGSDAAAEWASGVCDCCQDKRQCCLWFWCCPCSACRLSKSLGQCLCLPLLDVCGCVRPISFSMRVLVRQRYGIRGTMCRDCLCSTFCVPCVWCQISREVSDRKLPAGLGDLISR